MLRQAQHAEDQGRNYHCLVGAQLTSNDIAYLIHSHGGELFVFALSGPQAAIEDAAGKTLQFVLEAPGEPAPDPFPIHIECLEAVNQGWTVAAPNEGRCSYTSIAAFDAQPCLQFSLLLRSANSRKDTRRVDLFHYPLHLPPHGTLAFVFPPLVAVDKDARMARQQVAVAFARFATEPRPAAGSPAQPLSNAAASLFDFS